MPNTKKAHIIYHTDADGYCSGAIVYRYLIANGIATEDIKFHPVKYGDAFPEEALNKDDLVVIVDFSFPMETMEKVAAVISWWNLIWLDHHKTSYEEMMAYPYNSVINTKGRRINSSQPDQRLAGCELTWDFFNPDAAMPMLVARLGAYDTWRYTENPDQSYQDRVLNLQEGCCGLPKGGDIADPSALAAWMDLLYDPDNSKLEDITQNGAEYREKTAKRNAAICSKQAFETTFAGHRAIAVNATIYSSQLFLSVYDKKKHDLMVVFSHLKEGYWKLSLYSENPAIDCGATCKALSMLDPNPPTESKGGGHVGAGGFQASWSYLTTLFGGVK